MSGKSAKKGGGAPLWIVTFADLMSLLLTFFVLLLSFSTMEVQAFKKMAGAMQESFGLQSFDRFAGIIELEGGVVGTAPKNVVAVPLPELDLPDEVGPSEEIEPSPEPSPEPKPVEEAPAAPSVKEQQAVASQQTFDAIETVMADEIASDVMDIIRAGNTIVVRFPDEVSFPSGSGELKAEFQPVLGKFLSVLEQSKGQIIISGHTDDLPISTEQYRSNWDLSASRATSVAHFILKFTSIPSSRIAVQGYADSRPLAPNDSPEHRAKNRRVEITIQQVGEPRPAGDSADIPAE